MSSYDYIIVGSGIAGLYTALLAREHGSVLILTKGSIEDCNTRYAQGGIAAAVGADDSPSLHMQDTLTAGAGLADPETVRILAEEGPDRIVDLIGLGVRFDTEEGEVHLTREAAHSVARVLHAGGDATGKYIELTLAGLARMSKVTVLEHCLATELVVEDGECRGVRALDCRTGATEEFTGRYIILAAGGAGRLFKYTTNPEVATGDGVALAYEAGAEIADMEFYQFHPTALHLAGAPPFLISEAIRGEGGLLRNVEGERFMANYDPRGELAPRDIVARSTLQEMRRTATEHVLLDVTHLPAQRTRTRFPSIYQFCLDHGVDMVHQPIPVAPAAHYMMGGVRTNTWGETSIPRLFACGEVASVGVHGANRLASNSLLETLVFGKRVVQRTLSEGKWDPHWPWGRGDLYRNLPPRMGLSEISPPSLAAVQDLMWQHAGIVRDGSGLVEASETLAPWLLSLGPALDRPSYELRHLVLLGRLLTEAALVRQESRGAHYRTDFPHPSPEWERHIVMVKGISCPT